MPFERKPQRAFRLFPFPWSDHSRVTPEQVGNWLMSLRGETDARLRDYGLMTVPGTQQLDGWTPAGVHLSWEIAQLKP